MITDERLLEIARQVFLERGIRATTADVAERAGVSEATVFHRYKTKDALFRAAMDFDIERPPPFLTALEQKVGHGDPAEHLFDVGMAALASGRERIPLMMMSWSNPEAMLHRLSGCEGLFRVYELLIRYVEAESRAGRLHPAVDARIFAFMFHGSIQGYLMLELIAPRSVMPPDTFVRGMVNVLLGQRTGPSRGASRKKRASSSAPKKRGVLPAGPKRRTSPAPKTVSSRERKVVASPKKKKRAASSEATTSGRAAHKTGVTEPVIRRRPHTPQKETS
ncbi:uncharacterized protein CMC5_084510 [Chondromyces crocatus]|uniref:HTH tetR-type domain-containing protein n=2 Tax=Chondromyces crocatus TaxID=52 RepID=A0A0K1ETM6_CHOCO|nr:uncharacterized protein CMC5_084510 [Chondromyces crocatus]